MMENIFSKSVAGRTGVDAGKTDENTINKIPENIRRAVSNGLPELSELDVVRHFTGLSRENFSVDTNFYPLGSCTMKYNPKINEAVAALPGFTGLHPYTAMIDESAAQGALEVLYEISRQLCEITGMKRFTTQPYAGAHGELLGMLLTAAYHRKKGNNKKYVIVPESAHGTNPASAAAAGYSIITVKVDAEGGIDIDSLKEKMSDEVAAIMMTLPSTLGVFEKRIKEVIEIAGKHDTLMYYDGANLNAILGKLRPGDVGFDIVHINLHKTFSTPHGGGGPGSGVVGVSERLLDFLPVPVVAKDSSNRFILDYSVKNSIGQIASFFGNFGVILKAYTYILMLGREGLIDLSEKAVLNANYCMAKLKPFYDLPYDRICMHEVVFTAKRQAKNGVHATDIAKALIDRGIHPPTVYFPLVVEEAIMIEPTETESKQTIDVFIEAMKEIADTAAFEPQKIKDAPITTEISRPDETKAARDLKLTCF
jgi:glycine dehydrogenase subunit 2